VWLDCNEEPYRKASKAILDAPHSRVTIALARGSRCHAKRSPHGAGARTMAAKVFISYRRADSAGYSGRVMDRLDRELGRGSDRIQNDSGLPQGLSRTWGAHSVRRSAQALE
jgi:hypothetical protein